MRITGVSAGCVFGGSKENFFKGRIGIGADGGAGVGDGAEVDCFAAVEDQQIRAEILHEPEQVGADDDSGAAGGFVAYGGFHLADAVGVQAGEGLVKKGWRLVCAGPVGAEQAQHLAGLDIEGEPVDSDRIAVGFVVGYDLNHDDYSTRRRHRLRVQAGNLRVAVALKSLGKMCWE
jgi:hypothetical protein